MSDFVGVVIAAFLFFLYVFGMYHIISDDHRYTTKDVVIGAIAFPYPWWVGAKTDYRLITTSSEDRKFEQKCLDASEALGMRRNSRLRYCECLIATRNPEACKTKIFIQ